MIRINKKCDEYNQKWIGKKCIFLLIKIFKRYAFHNNVKVLTKLCLKRITCQTARGLANGSLLYH